MREHKHVENCRVGYALGFCATVEEVVYAFIYRRLHKSATFADTHDLCDFEGHVVAQAELLAVKPPVSDDLYGY